MTVHDFNESLALSNEMADAPWWGEVYREAFPGLASFTSVRDDGWAQRGGIDRVVTLKSGKSFWIDEKVREKAWPDVLLERWSDKDRRTPGWIQKPLATDFIAYAYIESGECLLLPFHTLRSAWGQFGRHWIAAAEAKQGGFRIVHAENRGYTTESVAVPKDELFRALTDAMAVSFRPPERDAA